MIGVGGLGHVGVQVLRTLCPTQIIAIDTKNPDKKNWKTIVPERKTADRFAVSVAATAGSRCSKSTARGR